MDTAHEHTTGDEATRFWEDRHRDGTFPGADRANPRLAEIAAGLPPGTALDLGCGPGGDTVWLAGRGWQVTAVDISGAAVDRLTARAGTLGLGDRIRAERHDLAHTFPDGEFDLVSAQYLHTPFEFDRAGMLRTAATRLRPGGHLLVVDHGSVAPWMWVEPDFRFPGPREVADGIGLDPAIWTIVRADSPEREGTGPNGETATVADHVLLVRRTG